MLWFIYYVLKIDLSLADVYNNYKFIILDVIVKIAKY